MDLTMVWGVTSRLQVPTVAYFRIIYRVREATVKRFTYILSGSV